MKLQSQTDLLLVDDEAEMRDLLVDYFSLHGFHTRAATDAASAREAVAVRPPGVAILDVHMPGEDGLSLARWLRAHHPSMGLVFLTGDGDPVERVIGLEVGGDDYVAKPFEPRELLARVKSLLRRLHGEGQAAVVGVDPGTTHRVPFGQCKLDLDEHRLIGADGGDIPISAAEFDLLALFARSPNRPLTRDQIMQGAHNRSWGPFDRSIDLRIMRLRRKIERNPDKPEILKTVRNRGYVFVLKAAQD
jgi:DNA-binding response OmpR family regulator